MLNEVKRNILASPERILLDFESAAVNAFRSALPSATVTGCHGRPQKFFQGGKATFRLSFSDCWRCNANGHIKKEMFSVTATVAYSVFLVRRFYIEKMFVLVSMDFLKLS